MRRLHLLLLLIPFIAGEEGLSQRPHLYCPSSPRNMAQVQTCYYQYYWTIGNNFNCYVNVSYRNMDKKEIGLVCRASFFSFNGNNKHWRGLPSFRTILVSGKRVVFISQTLTKKLLIVKKLNPHWKYEEMPQTDSKEASGAPLPDCAHWSRSDSAFFATILFIEKGKLAET